MCIGLLFRKNKVMILTIIISFILVLVDYLIIKNYRNLTKQDKKVTTILKAIGVIPVLFLFNDIKGVVLSIVLISILFDLGIGYLLTGKLFYLGNNSVLDELGDKLDGKKDNYGLLYFGVKLIIFGILILVL